MRQPTNTPYQYTVLEFLAQRIGWDEFGTGVRMFKQWRRQRAIQRVKAGDGRPVKRFRWWQFMGRALFHLRLPGDAGEEVQYTVDVRHWGNSGPEVKADLYLNGRHEAQAQMPAIFPVAGGVIEVKMSAFGLKRCHYVTDGSHEEQLSPDPKSAEGRRAKLENESPGLSRFIGTVAILLLVVGLGLDLIQFIEPISEIPPIQDNIGSFTSPIQLPLWLNITLVTGAILGSMERALRMQYHWLLDGGAN